MPHRPHDPDIWISKRWFKKLDPGDKLVYLYIKDRVDWAGIWHINVLNLLDDTGLSTFDLKEFINKANTDYDKMTGKQVVTERFILFEEKGQLWLTGFIQFQNAGNKDYVSLKSLNLFSALEKLKSYGLLKTALEKRFVRFRDDIEPHIQGVLTGVIPPSISNSNSYILECLKKIRVIETEEGGMGGKKIPDGNPPTKFNHEDENLLNRMANEYRLKHEEFQCDKNIHYPQLMSIAVRIAKWKKWSKESVTNGKLEPTVKAWKEIMDFCSADKKWWSSRTIQDLNSNNEWDRLINSIGSFKKENKGNGLSVAEIQEKENRRKLGITK